MANTVLHANAHAVHAIPHIALAVPQSNQHDMLVIDLTCDEPHAHIPLAMEVVDLTSDEA